jgi:D-glycero-D-manno-heptose 1,7-bisphosphate phosphatase
MRRAIFIDKDGTLVPDIPYNVDPAYITIEKHAVEGLRSLQEHDFLLVVISNQAGIARGFFQEDDLHAVEETIKHLLAKENIHLDGFYYCPHHPDGVVKQYKTACACRKPKPGLILQAARDLAISLHDSWMIGDILNDVEAGNRAGCKSILINNGNETEWLAGDFRDPVFIASTINDASQYIIHHDHAIIRRIYA